ncbi:MAG: alpha/beta fold hydrolase [Verrucomicrobiota bacterium]
MKLKSLSLLYIPFLIASAASAQSSRFDNWDKNKDDKLSREELPEPLRKNFDRVDKNGDGSISRAEDAAVGANRNAKGKGKGNRPRNPAPNLPDSIEVLKDLPYADNDNPRQALDLYLPRSRDAEKPLPLLVFIHGGGWQSGSKDGAGRRLAPFLESGHYAGASIGYRLTDEATWPSQIHDCKAALRWLRAHAAQYHLDPDRVAVWGTSAGGHLVAMLGVTHEVDGLEGELGSHDDEDSSVQAVINFFGPSELHTMNDDEDYPSTMDHNAPNSPESKLVGGPIQENLEISRNASPLSHVSEDDAPTLIVHGTKDPLVPFPQSLQLDERLDDAGVSSTLITVEGAGHGRGFPPRIQALIETFLAHHLLGAEKAVSEETLSAAP